MTEEEYSKIFLGSLMVSGVQIIMVVLILEDMLGPNFKVEPA